MKPRRARPSYAGFFQANGSDEEQTDSGEDMLSESAGGSSELEETSMIFDKDEDVEAPDLVPSDALGSVGRRSGPSQKIKKHRKRQDNYIGPDSQGVQSISQPQRLGHLTRNIKSREHRYRPDSLWVPTSDVLRLSRKPEAFEAPLLVPTNSSSSPTIAYRVKKSWMYSIGPGPCWELVEDRAFFKEECIKASIRDPRPLVYAEAPNRPGSHKRLSLEQSKAYVVESPPIFCLMGPHGNQDLQKIDQFSSVAIGGAKQCPSIVFNTGGHVMAAEWCPTTYDTLSNRGGQQYLAVSANNGSFKLGTRSRFPASIQLWSIKQAENNREMPQARCETLMYVDEGVALQLKWCPLPSHSKEDAPHTDKQTLGIFAAVMTDGAAYIYKAPKPDEGSSLHRAQQVGIRPLATMAFSETTCQALDWANSEVIGIGCSNGCLGIFRVKDAILGTGQVVLTHYFPVHQTSIQSIAWARVPPGSSNGTLTLAEDPTIICTTGSEGSVKATDIRDCMSRMLFRNREVPHACAFTPFCGSLVATDVDFSVKLFQLQPTSLGMGHSMADVGGTALALSVSDMHPYVAIGSADGSCITTNLLRGTRREGAVPFLNHKIFQLDYSPISGQYRMLDQFFPQENGNNGILVYKESAPRKVDGRRDAATTGEKFEQGRLEPSGLWHPNVGVTTVAWNSGCGLGSAPFLACGTVSGLIRVDYLEGMWTKGAIPYVSIERIRGEAGLEEGGSEAESE